MRKSALTALAEDVWPAPRMFGESPTPEQLRAIAEAAIRDDWSVRPMVAFKPRQTKREKRAAYHAAKAALRRPPKPVVAPSSHRATFRFMVEGVGIERHPSIADARKAHPGRSVRRATAKE